MGYVEELPSGRYRGVAWNAASRRRAGSATFGTWTEADAWWRRREGELDGTYTAAGVPVARQVRGVPTFAEFILSFAASIDGEKSTRARARTNARGLAARWPSERLDEVTRPMIRAYMVAMRDDGLGAGSREGRLVLLRKAMAAAVEQGHRGDDPTVGIKAPAAVRSARPIITDAQLDAVMARMPRYLAPAVLLSHDSGLRIGEVCGLRWHRVDLLHAQVLVADVIDTDGTLREYPKGKRALTVPLSPRTRQALTDHMRFYPPASPTAHVFTGPTDDKRLRPTAVRREWRRALTAAGLDQPWPRWHDLRHAAATKMARAGVPATVLRQLMRHENLATTQGYVEDVGREELSKWQGRAMGGPGQRTSADEDDAGEPRTA